MQITRYKDFSDSKTLIEVEEGKTLREAVPLKDWSQYVILVNGIVSDENYVLKKGDLVSIRTLPRGTTAVLIGLAVLAVGAASYAGYKSYEARKEAERAQKEIDKIKNLTQDNIVNVPYLKGASNTVATGRSQPYVIGRHLFTPYILNGGKNYKGFHTISGTEGKDSFYTVVLEGGFNKQIIVVNCPSVRADAYQSGKCVIAFY